MGQPLEAAGGTAVSDLDACARFYNNLFSHLLLYFCGNLMSLKAFSELLCNVTFQKQNLLQTESRTMNCADLI